MNNYVKEIFNQDLIDNVLSYGFINASLITALICIVVSIVIIGADHYFNNPLRKENEFYRKWARPIYRVLNWQYFDKFAATLIITFYLCLTLTCIIIISINKPKHETLVFQGVNKTINLSVRTSTSIINLMESSYLNPDYIKKMSIDLLNEFIKPHVNESLQLSTKLVSLASVSLDSAYFYLKWNSDSILYKLTYNDFINDMRKLQQNLNDACFLYPDQLGKACLKIVTTNSSLSPPANLAIDDELLTLINQYNYYDFIISVFQMFKVKLPNINSTIPEFSKIPEFLMDKARYYTQMYTEKARLMSNMYVPYIFNSYVAISLSLIVFVSISILILLGLIFLRRIRKQSILDERKERIIKISIVVVLEVILLTLVVSIPFGEQLVNAPSSPKIIIKLDQNINDVLKQILEEYKVKLNPPLNEVLGQCIANRLPQKPLETLFIKCRKPQIHYFSTIKMYPLVNTTCILNESIKPMAPEMTQKVVSMMNDAKIDFLKDKLENLMESIFSSYHKTIKYEHLLKQNLTLLSDIKYMTEVIQHSDMPTRMNINRDQLLNQLKTVSERYKILEKQRADVFEMLKYQYSIEKTLQLIIKSKSHGKQLIFKFFDYFKKDQKPIINTIINRSIPAIINQLDLILNRLVLDIQDTIPSCYEINYLVAILQNILTSILHNISIWILVSFIILCIIILPLSF